MIVFITRRILRGSNYQTISDNITLEYVSNEAFANALMEHHGQEDRLDIKSLLMILGQGKSITAAKILFDYDKIIKFNKDKTAMSADIFYITAYSLHGLGVDLLKARLEGRSYYKFLSLSELIQNLLDEQSDFLAELSKQDTSVDIDGFKLIVDRNLQMLGKDQN